MPRLLIVSYWFEPFESSGSNRIKSFVSNLSQLGWDICVLTVSDSKWSHSGRKGSENSGIEVHRLKGFSWSVALRRLSGNRLKGAAEATVAEGRKPSFLKSLALSIYKNHLSYPDECWPWYMLGKGRALKFAKEFKPDIIFSSAMPFSSHQLAASISRELNVPWVAEYRDLLTDNPFYEREPATEKKLQQLEKEVLQGTRKLITISKDYASKLEEQVGVETDVVYNGFDGDAYSDVTPKNPKCRLVYTGMVYPEHQDIDLFFRSLSALNESNPDVAKKLEFRYFGPNNGLMDMLAETYDVKHMVISSEAVAREIALAEQAQADALVFFSFEFPGCLSGKIFEYIGAGKPILAIGPHNRETDELLKTCGYESGILSEEARISESIKAFLAQWNDLGHLHFRANENRAQYSRHAQAERLHNILSEACR